MIGKTCEERSLLIEDEGVEYTEEQLNDKDIVTVSKIKVNGKDADPLYNYLKSVFPGRIKWNFSKFLIDREGHVVKRFNPTDKPESLESDIMKYLG